MQMLHALAGMLLALLTPLAGPYRAVTWKSRCFGGVMTGLLTWAGIIVIFPICCILTSPYASAWGFFGTWGTLILLAYIQMFTQWCSSQTRRDAGESHAWAGRYEPLLAAGLCFLVPAGGVFFLMGYLSSLLQVGLVRLRRRCAAWTPEDTKRVFSPVGAGTQRAAVALRAGALFLAPFAVSLLTATKFLFARNPRPAMADGTVAGVATPGYRPQSFSSRVMVFLVGHSLFSLCTNLLSVIGIFGILFKCFTLAIAFFLASLGWVVEAPEAVKEEAHGIIRQAQVAIDDRKGHVRERLEEEKAELTEQIDEQRQELEGEIHRRKRRAVWNYLTR